ncbi:hypothetical protein CCACVL1_06389 [Corchorus capsularis]|uniref:FBD domain-containing protein n=1 Tax=Corchorus capsularis TaxID=210143 RepID=A0A1R3JFV5_COCAP|nr:hypothetical protein CCACVL1_06389 [Corchorus capsularis]
MSLITYCPKTTKPITVLLPSSGINGLFFASSVDDEEGGIDPLLNFLKDQDSLHDCLHRLREVELTNYLNGRYLINMVKFLLAKSLTLEKMVIQPREGIVAAEDHKVLKQVNRFKRVSPNAEIIHLEPNERLV